MPLCRGTRLIEGKEAYLFRKILLNFRLTAQNANFEEIILPAIYSLDPWVNRCGAGIEEQMWTFQDRGNRDVCLIPEATAILQEQYDVSWSKSRPKPVCLFYETRCYRYERPQAGRYREFTQFGVEMLGPNPQEYQDSIEAILRACFYQLARDDLFEFDFDVKRGLSYYSRNGFEVRCEKLGAQKQVAGGGTYAQGCGFAIGVDRVCLALQ